MKCVAYFLVAVLTLTSALAEDEESETWTVTTAQGPVRGRKDPKDGIYTFFGIPYATAPSGRDRFKAPLAPPSWITPLEAADDNVVCPQYIFPQFSALYDGKHITENCLVANVYVPNNIDKNLPVVVYVHGGAFQMGQGNLHKPMGLVKTQNVIVVTFNYRLGIHGFLCLGTEIAPGNAGMKDQVALLHWVSKNIASFGGNSKDVTIAGFSAGSASVDLLMLSPMAKGLFTKVIPESGGNLAEFSVQIDPLKNAEEFARRYGKVNNIQDLEEFYISASLETITSDLFFDRKDSTFVFSPCVERKSQNEVFLGDSPYNILKTGNYEKLPLLYGFADSEGLLRIDFFQLWKTDMTKKFSDFLPADLQFKSDKEKESVAKKVKEFYFGDTEVNEKNVLRYVDFFSDVLFTYPMMAAVKMHVDAGHDKVFLYEYTFTDDSTPVIPHTNVRGANHCAQTRAVFDGITMTNLTDDNILDEFKKMKKVMRELWGNFIKTGTPVPEGSPLAKWPPTGRDGFPYMSLGSKMELHDKPLLEDRMRMWEQVYKKYYRQPQPPSASFVKHIEL